MSKNNRFCIVEKNLREHHAGSKARNDVADILRNCEWNEIIVSSPEVRVNAGLKDKMKMALIMRNEWKEIVKTIPENAILFIQYPLDMYPKISMLASKYIRKIRNKNVKIIVLIHDLDSLRENDADQKQWDEKREKLFLGQADLLIVHNNRMAEYLEKKGYSQKKIPLKLFDYLDNCTCKDNNANFDKSGPIIIAGNLDPVKAGYIYKLGELDGKVNFRLYGPGYRPEEKTQNVKYMGTYSPNELLKQIDGAYGLVWDGESIEGCRGGYGEYMKYNNPHKLSLYIAAGVPVIVWKEAATAEFVDETGIGFSVNSLDGMGKKRGLMSADEYKAMVEKVQEISCKVKKGDFLQYAVSRSIDELDSQG